MLVSTMMQPHSSAGLDTFVLSFLFSSSSTDIMQRDLIDKKCFCLSFVFHVDLRGFRSSEGPRRGDGGTGGSGGGEGVDKTR